MISTEFTEMLSKQTKLSLDTYLNQMKSSYTFVLLCHVGHEAVIADSSATSQRLSSTQSGLALAQLVRSSSSDNIVQSPDNRCKLVAELAYTSQMQKL